jgi:ribosomal protein S18 acetylase RimI-like enzyme
MSKRKISLVKARAEDWQKVLGFEKASKSKFFSALKTEKEVKEYLAESQVYLDGLTISPDQRGKGYAKTVVHLLLGKAKKFKRAYMRVHPENPSVLVILLKEGFKITGWEDNHYGDNEPRLLLEKYYH